jgi:hypothetical protein
LESGTFLDIARQKRTGDLAVELAPLILKLDDGPRLLELALMGG